ncbi:hypothetical protein [Actinoplanes subtropicus]|uniref:hypothetical protein n=1 Tax=Actinoplanes subtropicus TaxID=543632 RepID=UPI000551B3FE|nr:hypothetical protein [Actinoplanes subtropicus]
MDERELRDRLRTVNVPASRLEVETLVHTGRQRVVRRRTWRAAVGAALAVGVLVALPSLLARPEKRAIVVDTAPSISAKPPSRTPSQAPSQTPSQTPARAVCAMTALPVPAGLEDVQVAGVDPTGRYIVGNATRGNNWKPVLWTGGQARALAVLGPSMQLTGVNAAGVVVGQLGLGSHEQTFRYQNGKYTRLTTPAGSWHAFPQPVINTAGDIVVNVEPSGNSGGEGSIVLFWPAGEAAARKLPLPAGANVLAILDDGTLVGALYKNGSAIAAYTWDQQGHGTKLATPKGQTSAAYAARGDWATGGFWPAMSTARWNLRTGEFAELPTPPGTDLPPALTSLGAGSQVNANGWVVADGYAVHDGGAAHLPVPKGQRASAVAVADDNLVVGQALSTSGTLLGPRMWRC